MPPDASHGALPSPSFDTEALAISSLRHAIESRHGCAARFAESVVVWELLKGEIVEERTVYAFDLSGHPETTVAYAWRSATDLQSTIVLRQGDIVGPDDAVRAVILARR
ncbi:MAG: hypothetical protein IKE60_31310 [Reyranella sp.]|jgi:hypothetical protein|uniref:hypothetical protein n=1 Tax=Reyranella sp. TaxID=1929291 RepID=UPI0009623E5A|nr:hypothetical protein [Reyranella sp.]MBN9540310.1 hypothetical protein [Alphaproteobacteria bacterium]MBR2819198.1 hypothetical protein [Reyranella sp.]OJU47091.1 MAG: hypothetical protein BGN99_29880 [Alphaproteobacteria bacterium 65-37]